MLGLAESGRHQVVAVGAQHGEVGETVDADHAEAELAAVDECGSPGAPRPGHDVGAGEQESVRGERDRAAGARRHLAAAAAPHHAEVGDAGGEPFGHVDDDARVGVERLGLAPLGLVLLSCFARRSCSSSPPCLQS